MTKAREVDMLFMNKGPERATKLLITELLERVGGIERTVSELATLQIKMADSVNQVVHGAGMIRQQVEKMQGIGVDDDDDLPPTAQ